MTAAILRGAHIVRVHDVKATIETALVADALRSQKGISMTAENKKIQRTTRRDAN
jgi:dihydropteroate synthase